MTIPNLLQPGVPIVGGSVMTPQWWRWFRELVDGVSPLDSLSNLAPGKYLDQKSLVVGNNTIAHGLGATPTGWIAFRPVGAFGTSGSSGETIYPALPEYNVSYSDDDPGVSTDTLSFTMDAAPAEGSLLVAAIFRDNTEANSVISGITQTGVTWSEAVAVPGNASANALMLWAGVVGAGASASGTVNFATSQTSENAIIVAEFPQGSSATPTGGDSCYVTGTRVFNSKDEMTEPTVAAGNIIVHAMFVVNDPATYNPLSASHMQQIGVGHCAGTTADCIAMWAGVAQYDQKYPLVGMIESTATSIFYSAAFSSNIAGVTPAAITIPHGVREVSSDETNIVVESVSNVSMDFWVF